MSGPSITVMSVFGQARIEVSDGENSIALNITKEGVKALIGELEMVLSHAEEFGDDDED